MSPKRTKPQTLVGPCGDRNVGPSAASEPPLSPSSTCLRGSSTAGRNCETPSPTSACPSTGFWSSAPNAGTKHIQYLKVDRVAQVGRRSTPNQLIATSEGGDGDFSPICSLLDLTLLTPAASRDTLTAAGFSSTRPQKKKSFYRLYTVC